MGYSCTSTAADTLAVIGKMFATDGNPNILTIGKAQYFFERGRETQDGAIVGSLYKMLPGDMCRKAGSVRISPDGDIVRFPAMSKPDQAEAVNTMRDMSARNPALLRAWGIGRI